MSTFASETVTQLDQFHSGLRSFISRVTKNTRALMITGAVILLAGIAAAFFLQKKGASEAAGRDALFKAEQKLVEEQGTGQTKVAGFEKIDASARFPEAIKAFEKTIAEYPGTRAAFLAQIRLGDLQMTHGQAEQAIGHYEKAAKMASEPLDRALGHYAVAMAQENSGKSADALKAYEKALNVGQTSLSGEFLLGIARTSQAAGDVTRARSTLEKITKDLADTDYAKKAQALLSELK